MEGNTHTHSHSCAPKTIKPSRKCLLPSTFVVRQATRFYAFTLSNHPIHYCLPCWLANCCYFRIASASSTRRNVYILKKLTIQRPLFIWLNGVLDFERGLFRVLLLSLPLLLVLLLLIEANKNCIRNYSFIELVGFVIVLIIGIGVFL